jgi:hypothetical protein
MHGHIGLSLKKHHAHQSMVFVYLASRIVVLGHHWMGVRLSCIDATGIMEASQTDSVACFGVPV